MRTEALDLICSTLAAVYVIWLLFMLGLRWYVHRSITLCDLQELAAWPVGLPRCMLKAARVSRRSRLAREKILRNLREKPDGIDEPGDDVGD